MLLFLLAGCSSATKLKTTFSFPEETWNRFNNPVLNFDITTPGIFYDMFLELEFDEAQARDKFMVTVIMYTPSGEMRSRDMDLNFSKKENITEPGKIRLVLRREFAFSDKGVCQFEIENRSSKVVTPGMKSISVVFERSQ